MWADTTVTSARPRSDGNATRRSTWNRLVVRFNAAITQPFQRWLRLQRALSELASLNDRDLADLGLTRGDFTAIRSGTFTRGSSPEANIRPVTFAPLPDEPQRPQRQKHPAPVFIPFGLGMHPSWFNRYWYGED